MGHEKSGRRNLVLLAIAAFSIIILIGCIFAILLYSMDSFKQSKENAKLKEMIGDSSVVITEDQATGLVIAEGEEPVRTEEGILTKYRDLYELNKDMVGWISIEDTKIDYPVMQTIYDEEYYLYRDFYGKDNKEGVPFMDDRCIPRLPNTNLIIYGHNMKNGDMFADLLKYQDKDYYEKHKYIRFDTVYEEGLYEIIAVFRTRVAYKDENTFRFYNFLQADSEEDFYDYISNIRALSLYETESGASVSDYLLTLTTCEYTVEDGRFVVVARKISN